MVLDSSALIAVLFGVPEAEALLERLSRAPRLFMSSFSWFETLVVAEARKGSAGAALVEQFLAELGVERIAFDGSQAEVALDAWRRFGKGRHPAGLNLGACASYALARTLGQPLLFPGTDFSRTDVAVAL